MYEPINNQRGHLFFLVAVSLYKWLQQGQTGSSGCRKKPMFKEFKVMDGPLVQGFLYCDWQCVLGIFLSLAE